MSARCTVSEADTASFHTMCPRLFGIAYQVLVSANEADDVVQDGWIRWQDTDRSKVRDAAAFLATTTTRLAINITQSARGRRETHVDPSLPEPADADADTALAIEQREALELAVQMLLGNCLPPNGLRTCSGKRSTIRTDRSRRSSARSCVPASGRDRPERGRSRLTTRAAVRSSLMQAPFRS